jgi:hypothetical protein
MDPVGYDMSAKKGIMLIFKCRRCHQTTRNMAAHEDPVAPDNYELILKLSYSSKP